jgi:hypothetical protein
MYRRMRIIELRVPEPATSRFGGGGDVEGPRPEEEPLGGLVRGAAGRVVRSRHGGPSFQGGVRAGAGCCPERGASAAPRPGQPGGGQVVSAGAGAGAVAW